VLTKVTLKNPRPLGNLFTKPPLACPRGTYHRNKPIFNKTQNIQKMGQVLHPNNSGTQAIQ
jgi:hypothetical protein